MSDPKFSAIQTWRDYEKAKYVPTENDDVAVNVVLSDRPRALVQGVDYDRIDINYPTNKTEEHIYSLVGVIIQTITLEYLTGSKKDLINVVYS